MRGQFGVTAGLSLLGLSFIGIGLSYSFNQIEQAVIFLSGFLMIAGGLYYAFSG